MKKVILSSLCFAASLCANDTGLAPEVIDLNAKDASIELERRTPYLSKAFISLAPQDMNDGLKVGALNKTGIDESKVLGFIDRLAEENPNKTDSLLISHKGSLMTECYFRRGRQNLPHYQMSITKSYTAFAIGRAIQLGYLTMEDMHKPVIGFLKELDRSRLAPGAEKITLYQAMIMGSGIRLSHEKINRLRKNPEALKGQGQIQAYLQHSDPIGDAPRKFKYQPADTAITMQVLESVVPGSAKDFIAKELFAPIGISDYAWQKDLSDLPKSAAGSSFCSRDMMKVGELILKEGKWNGQQHLPKAFINTATSALVHSYATSYYGYFCWNQTYEIEGKKYLCKQLRGAGGQFIFVLPEIELVIVMTSHAKGMGTMLQDLVPSLVPLFENK
ncbi:beta-lactamase [Lentisphaera araneosa HTCC2155]|jgi:CubicO group peptidase (beta-lactamase class C family)|uniref:Beta-lactamase n=1 Tax=Lentisphaera araneosa HTCC2155 TaxID=313628 RepID=A6DKD1_9BACT|nr:serine hydrolase [Lentisphaera araneosa]EDM27829.1 beta-lactamase [Lentisphaera araneosa HTCC2155]